MKPTDRDEPIDCPHCKVSLLGPEVPKEDREYYYGNYFKREIGVEIPEIYDGVYYYYCPDCKGEWGGHRSLPEK